MCFHREPGQQSDMQQDAFAPALLRLRGHLACPQTPLGDLSLWIPRESSSLTCFLPVRVKSRHGRVPQQGCSPAPPPQGAAVPVCPRPGALQQRPRVLWQRQVASGQHQSRPGLPAREFLPPEGPADSRLSSPGDGFQNSPATLPLTEASLTAHGHQHGALAFF